MSQIYYRSQLLASTYGSSTYNKANYNGTNVKSTAVTGTATNSSAGGQVSSGGSTGSLNGAALVAASSMTFLVLGILVFMIVRIWRRPHKLPDLVVEQVEDIDRYVVG